MNNIKVGNNQSFADITLQFCGNIEYIVDYAMQNNVCITGEMEVGRELEPPKKMNKTIVNYLSSNDVVPATAISRSDERNLCDEVGDNTADFGTFDYTFNDSFYK